MLTLVVSSPDKFNSEIDHVKSLLEAGLPIFHVRKPKFSARKMKAYLSMIPEKFHSRLVIHSHHELALKFNIKGIHLTERHRNQTLMLWWKLRKLRWKKPELSITASFHSLEKMNSDNGQYDYVFFSPVFRPISKKHKAPKYSHDQIRQGLHNCRFKVVALGGVSLDRLESVVDMGFQGVAMLGEIWNGGTTPLQAYQRITEFRYRAVRPVSIKNLRIAR